MNKLNIDLKKRLGTGLKKAVSLTLAAMLVITSVNVIAKADSSDIQIKAREIYLKGDDTNKLGTFQYGSASGTITKIVFEVNDEAKQKIGGKALCLFGENYSSDNKLTKNGNTYTFENLSVYVKNNIRDTAGNSLPKLVIKLGFDSGSTQAGIDIFDEVEKCDISTLLNGAENTEVITKELPYNNKNEYIVSVGLPSYKQNTIPGENTTYELQGYQNNDNGIYIKAKCNVTDNKAGDGKVISIEEFVPANEDNSSGDPVYVGGRWASFYNLDEDKTKDALNSKNLAIKIIKKAIKADDYNSIDVKVEQSIEAKDSKELKKKVDALTDDALTKAVRDKVKSQFGLSKKGSISFKVGSDNNAELDAVKTELKKVELKAAPQEKEYSYTYTVDNDEENYSGSIKGKVKFNIKKANASNPGVPGPQGPKQPNNKQSNNTGSIIAPIVDNKQDKQNSKSEQKSDNKDKKSMMATEDSKINLKAKTRVTRSKANITVSNKALKEAVMGSESADVYISDKSKANTVKLMLTKSNVKTLLDSEVNSITLKNNLMDVRVNGDSLFKLLSNAKNGLQISISKKANTYQLKVADKNNKPIATKDVLLVEIPAKGDKKLYVIENGKKIKVKSSFDSKNKVIKANIKTNSKFILK